MAKSKKVFGRKKKHLNFAFTDVKEIQVAAWSPDDEGKLPPEQVHMILKVGGYPYPLLTRFKGPDTLGIVIEELARYRRVIWPDSDRLKDMPEINAAEVIVALYNALEIRENCVNCGGRGWDYVDIDGEAEKDACSCRSDAVEALLRFKEQYLAAVDEYLRQQGYDPDKVGQHFQDLVEGILYGGEENVAKSEWKQPKVLLEFGDEIAGRITDQLLPKIGLTMKVFSEWFSDWYFGSDFETVEEAVNWLINRAERGYEFQFVKSMKEDDGA